MSTQPTSIILGPRYGNAADEATASDLQHVIGRVMAVLSQRRWLFVIPLLTGMLVSLAISLALYESETTGGTVRLSDVEALRVEAYQSQYNAVLGIA